MLLEPAGRGGDALQAALRAWEPSMPFEVLVRYWTPGRAASRMWTMPFLCDADGRVVHYLAVGPAGQPVAAHLVSYVDVHGLPEGASVQLLTDTNRAGVSVFGVPRHTPN